MASNEAAAAPPMLRAKIPMKLPPVIAAKTLSSILPHASTLRPESMAVTTGAAALPSPRPRTDDKDKGVASDAVPASSDVRADHAPQSKRLRVEAAERAVAVPRRASSTASSVSSYSSSSSSSSASSPSSSDNDVSSSSSSRSSRSSSSSRDERNKDQRPATSRGGSGGVRRRPRAVRAHARRAPRRRRRRRVAASRSVSDDDDAVPSHAASQSALLDADDTAASTATVANEAQTMTSQPNATPPRPPIMRSFPADIDKAIERCKERLNREENAVRIKDDNKAVSLGTSKVNYIDPRIICSWASAQGVPIKKIFSTTLLNKFPWALHAKNFAF